MEIPSIGDPTADPQIEAYFNQLDELTALAMAGEIDERSFIEEMLRITAAAILLMLLLGGGSAGDAALQAELAEQVRQARTSIRALADDVYSGRYSAVTESEAGKGRPKQTAEEGREKLLRRLFLWGNTLAGTYSKGQTLRAPRLALGGGFLEESFTWRLGRTERHCKDCAALNGRTMTVSEWREAGITPQSPDLACGGWRCDCRFEEAVSEPA